MIQYIIRRTLGFIPVLFAITLVTFILIRTIPGGPFQFVGDRELPETVVENINAKYHLDWPMWKQFASFLIGDDLLGEEGTSRGLIRGDLGPSFQYRALTVNDIIKTTLPASAQLGLLSLFLGLFLGVPMGVIAALRQNSWVDYSATFSAIFFLSVPNLVLAPILIWIFSLQLGWFKIAGWGSQPPYILGFLPNWGDWNIDYLRYAILPVFALGTGLAGGIARLTRASLLQVIREDYIRTARAKGLYEFHVITLHALKNSLIPVITILGPALAGLLTGSVVVEQIFGINGMGRHFVESIGNRDYPLLMGVTLIFSVLIVFSNLLVDIAYAFLDPRIRFD